MNMTSVISGLNAWLLFSIILSTWRWMKMAFLNSDSGCTKTVVEHLAGEVCSSSFSWCWRECFHSLTVTLWAWWAMSGLHANLWFSWDLNFIFKITLILWVQTYVPWWLFGGQRPTCGAPILSLYHMGPEGWAQVIKLGDNYHCHLTSLTLSL